MLKGNPVVGEEFQFNSPTSIAMYAPPFSGKTTLTRNILENANKLLTLKPHFIVYCYKETLPMLHDLESIIDIPIIQNNGIPTCEQMEMWSSE